MSKDTKPETDVTYVFEDPEAPALELTVCADDAGRIFDLAPELRGIRDALEATGTAFEVSMVATVYFYPENEGEDGA